MDSREILLYYSLKFSGDWDSIHKAIETKEEIDEKEARKLIKSNTSKYISYLDDEYPESLKRTPKPPFVLYYHGDISLISDARNKIAVVGSRKVSEYGAEVTTRLVSEIAEDFVIVSGLAYGVDALAHWASINNNGKTVAVLGCGINLCYLKENQDLYDVIKERHLLLSEYPNETPPTIRSFPIRNRIIAGLCENLLITEGKIASGTQITAFLMAGKDGNICCVPTHIGEDSICNHLISEGAFLVETAQDIYEVAHVVKNKPVFEN